MGKEYTKKQLHQIYKTLPKELKKVVFSKETADQIYDISVRNGIKEEQISEIAWIAGKVLLGLLPLKEFRGTLEQEMKLKPQKAKALSQEIYRFVFYPVKESISELYEEEVSAPKAEPQKKPKSSKKDIYREPIGE